jgi:hypothetical protein
MPHTVLNTIQDNTADVTFLLLKAHTTNLWALIIEESGNCFA